MSIESIEREDEFWTILCGENEVPLQIPTSIFIQVPFFEAVSRSGMIETRERKIKKLDISYETMKTIIKFLSFRLSKEDILEEVELYKKNLITIKTSYISISNELDSLPMDKREILIEELSFRAKIKKFTSFLPLGPFGFYEDNKAIADLKIAIDQLQIQAVANIINKIEILEINKKNPFFIIENFISSKTCASYFGSSTGCIYGKTCRYSHKCLLENRDEVIRDAVEYLARKNKNKYNEYDHKDNNRHHTKYQSL